MRERWRRLLVAGFVVGAVAALAAPVMYDLHARPIQSVRIAGEFRHVAQATLEAAIATHLQRGFFQVDVDAVRDAALDLPWVRDASVRRVWPGSLHVAVVERHAVAQWNGADLLEADGTVFHPETMVSGRDLPRLTGPPGSERLVLEHYEWLRAAFAATAVSVRRLDLDERGAWRAVLDGDVALVLGPRPNPDTVRRLAAAWPVVFGTRGAAAQRIDLRYANGFAVAWRTPGDGTGESSAK